MELTYPSWRFGDAFARCANGRTNTTNWDVVTMFAAMETGSFNIFNQLFIIIIMSVAKNAVKVNRGNGSTMGVVSF